MAVCKCKCGVSIECQVVMYIVYCMGRGKPAGTPMGTAIGAGMGTPVCTQQEIHT